MVKRIKPIGLSFKNNEEDRKLYYWIYEHSNVSGFIKDILRQKMNGREETYTKELTDNNELIDLSDF